MMQQIRILSPENFSTSLKSKILLNNTQHLFDFLTNQHNQKHINEITETFNFIINSEKLMSTKKDYLQIELCKCFIQFFRIIGSTSELGKQIDKYLYRFFNIICSVLTPLKKAITTKTFIDNTNSFDDRKDILQLCDQFDIFLRINDSGSFHEVFKTLSKIDYPEATSCLVKLLNNSIIFHSNKRNVFLTIFDTLDLEDDQNKQISNRTLKNLICQLDDAKKMEMIQNIRVLLQGKKIYTIYKKIASILHIEPLSIVDFAEFDFNNEDDQIRTISLTLAQNAFDKLNFSTEIYDKYKMMLEHQSDRSAKNRIIIIKFAFDLFAKIKRKSLSHGKSIEKDIFESVAKEIEDNFWNSIIQERIIDKSNEVRMFVIDELIRLNSKYINQNFNHIISFRLRDKCPDVRMACLNLMAKINNDKPESMNWLIFELIDMYPAITDISLYGFSIFIENRSIIEIAKELDDRTNLLTILNVITSFRKLIQNYINDNDSENTEKELEKYFKIQTIKQIIKTVPKNFFENALRHDSKYRHKLYTNLKEKMKEENALKIMGLYQPSPIEPAELISQNDTGDNLEISDYQIIKDLAKIYSRELVCEIPTLLQNLNKTNLLILTSLKNEDDLIDPKLRKKILKKILPLISISKEQINSEKREFALKTFARLIRKEQSYLIDNIKFDKTEFEQKLIFFAHFIDQNLVPSSFYNEIEKNLTKIKTEKMVKYALKISSNEGSKRSIEIHQHFMENYPDLVFDSFINNCALNNSSLALEPNIFRSFSSLIQHKNSDIREHIINSLSMSLKKFNTPIQFLAYFALSATDPYEPNRLKAKQELDSAILWRRELVQHYLIQNSTNQNVLQRQNIKSRKITKIDDNLTDDERKKLIRSIPKNINIETTIPFLINILTHHSDIDFDIPELHTFSIYLRFYFESICYKDTNISRLRDILFNLQMLQDCDDEEDDLKFTEKMFLLCELASKILKDIGTGCEWGPSMEETFEFSTRYFKSIKSKERIKALLNKKENEQHITQRKCEKTILRAGMSSKPAKMSGKRRVSMKKIENYEFDDEDAYSESDYVILPASNRIYPFSPTFIGKIISSY